VTAALDGISELDGKYKTLAILLALAKNAKSLDASIWYDCHSYVGIRFIHIDEV